MRRLSCILLVLAITACASLEAETPAQRVFAAQADYNGLLALAVAYESQPRCGAEATLACSSVKIVDRIRKADNEAHATLRGAQDVVRTPGVSDSTAKLALAVAVKAISVLRVILTEEGLI